MELLIAIDIRHFLLRLQIFIEIGLVPGAHSVKKGSFSKYLVYAIFAENQ
ncbi:MAG: hypothetical protein GY820_03380 [Gammaproteobacteria bacterium]|nr:hypothetical protein [Gammaproteobacteria bacterium]